MSVAGMLLASGCAPRARDDVIRAQDNIVLETLAISSNGRLVAFQFFRAPRGPRGLGLYEWQTGKLTRIPNPAGKQLGVPSFSYDDKRLAVVIGNVTEAVRSDIAVVDLATLAITQVIRSEPVAYRGRTSPVFRPGADAILYVEGGIGVPTHLKLIDLSDGTDKTILDEKHGFFAISRPYFVSSDEIYFTAIAPRDPTLKRAVEALAVAPPGMPSTIAFRLRFGGLPEILFPETEKELKAFAYHEGLDWLTVSRDGQDMVFIDEVNREATRGIYYMDLYRLKKDGQRIRLTNLNSYLAFSSIAYDGSAVAFGSDPMRQKRIDLSILDMRSGEVVPTGLLDKLQANPDFTSR